jgi:hypothetical protein
VDEPTCKGGLEFAKHDVGVDVTLLGMQECFRKLAYDAEAVFLPETDGAFVGADNEVELHGLEAASAGVIQGMDAHSACYTAAGGGWGGDVAAICDVRATAVPVCFQKVGTENRALLLGDENLVPMREPIKKCFFSAQVSWHRVGVAGANDRFEDGPNRVVIARMSMANKEHGP